jgi:hypothetical protein
VSAFPLPRLTALSRRPPWSLVKASSFVVCAPPLPRFIAEGRWVSWPAGDLVALLWARSESWHGWHSSRQAQLALSPFYGLEGRAADRGARHSSRHLNAASTLGAGDGAVLFNNPIGASGTSAGS